MPKTIMRSTLAALMTVMLVAILSLTGCAGKTTVTPDSLSHDNNSVLWFRIGDGKSNIYHEVSKDAVAYLYLFENGELTYLSNWGTQIGKLADMSDEDIVAMYKEKDEEYKDRYINREKYTVKPTSDYYVISEPWTIDSIELHTDNTGKTTEKELLAMYDVNAEVLQPSGRKSTLHDYKMWFSDPTQKAYQIYDNYYGGFKVQVNSESSTWFVTKLDSPDKYEFELDAPGTEGTETH